MRILFSSGIMNDGWDSDGESQTQYTPVYSQTFGRRSSHRGGVAGCDYGNWQGGGRRNYKNKQFVLTENGHGTGSRKFERSRGRNGKSGNWRENSSGGHNHYVGQSGGGTIVMVKSSDVGKIIGKGGSKIREMQDETGAYIQVWVH
jgi:hypothetical protein